MNFQNTEATQQPLVDWLSSAAAFGAVPERITTHASHLFLTPDRVYKLKRAVRYDFLDFRDADARAAACLREVEVNAPFSPGLYRRALPATRTETGFALGGQGHVVDCLVEMNRFDSNSLFVDLLKKDELDPGLLDQVVDQVSTAHLGIKPVAEPDAHAANRANADLVTATVPALHPLYAAIDAAGPKLNARAAAGFVRRCHGDLHLGNLCLFNGRPMPFDAIEFSEIIGTIDVLYDIAFLGMDLLAQERPDLAWRVLSRYLEATADYDGAGLLPLFMAIRAGVRAMIGALEGDNQKSDAYRDLALTLLRPRPPRLIAIGGRSGTGKTTLARRLIGPTGSLHLRSDGIRKRLHGVSPETTLPADAYGADVSKQVFERLFAQARSALTAGASVVLDATFMSPHHREAAASVARECGVPLQGIWLDLPEGEAVARAEARRADASDANADVVRAQYRSAVEPEGWLRLDARDPASLLLEQFERG